MGAKLSSITPSSTTATVDSYVAELGDVQYEKSLSSARFLKTVRGRTSFGLVVVKVFVKPDLNLDQPIDISKWARQLRQERDALADIRNAFPYIRCIETEKAGYLVRQHLYSSLYDRISTRPFLESIEKRWIAFQLLCGLRDCHAKGIHHGDIKTENVLVTSWNWAYLTDFACFKPTYLPEDNPADFSFFFDTSGRRVCYVAPERFHTSGESKDGEVTDAMDVFSLGCVIAELFLEGTPLFSLSQMFKYRKGEYDPVKFCESIEDEDIKSLVQNMIKLDPKERFSAEECLEHPKKGKHANGVETCNPVFPEYFSSFLHQYIYSKTDPSAGFRAAAKSASERITEGDERISSIYHEFDTIAFNCLGLMPSGTDPQVNGVESSQLSASTLARVRNGMSMFPVQIDLPNYSQVLKSQQGKAISSKDGGLIFLSLIVSTIRNTSKPQSRVEACDILLALSERISDEAKLDRVLPYLIVLLSDKNAIVRVAAIRTITQLLSNVKTLTPVHAFIFGEYVLPKLSNLPSDKDVFVRCTYASCIALLAESAARFLDIAQALRANGSLTYADDEAETTYPEGIYNSLYDVGRKELLTAFQKHVVALLSDPEASVRRALLGSITSLCIFFGRQRSNDLILTHLNTYLNDRDWMLRCAFFESIVGVATFVGGRSLEEYILPLLTPAITDTEEFVIEKVLNALTSLAELGLFQKSSILDLSKQIVKLMVHPNIWISNGAVGFLATAAKTFGPVDAATRLYPIVRPYLICDIRVISEQALLDYRHKPIPRNVYDAALKWAAEAQSTTFWKPFKDRSSVDVSSSPVPVKSTNGVSKQGDKSARTEEDARWFSKLRGLGMTQDDEWKLTNLRSHIWKVSESLTKAHAKREEKPTSIIHNTAIDLSSLGITPMNIFFHPPENGRRE